ncbi:hypothetical protein HMPREF3150_02481 [Pseudomonas aeruginosa]|nr:hypothetical protein HMPREF3150_02481 [Pseudomonas aeruginosa]
MRCKPCSLAESKTTPGFPGRSRRIFHPQDNAGMGEGCTVIGQIDVQGPD